MDEFTIIKKVTKTNGVKRTKHSMKESDSHFNNVQEDIISLMNYDD